MGKHTILLVDDDPIFMAVIEHVLGREGFGLIKAGNGKEALELARATQPPPSLVISDIMLPYIDGFHLIGELRALPGWQTIPIVMLTAKGQGQDIQKALEEGADDYLVKPFQHGELLARIRRFLR
jgi:DNA-binding response OmpR family regulator